MIEFTFVFMFLLVPIVFVLLDVSWALFARTTIQYAVRVGVRRGITITGTQATAANSNLTAMVKQIVQKYSLGFLQDTTKVKVRFYQPDTSTTGLTHVTTAGGNNPGNIIQVSVEGYQLPGLLPRIFITTHTAADTTATALKVTSADIIEQIGGDVPPIGTPD